MTFSPTSIKRVPTVSKAELFLSVFSGRRDIVPKFWTSRKRDRSGYSPLCKNEWKEGVCQKPCRTCTKADYIPLSDQHLLDHFHGKHILGIYPLLPNDTCHFLAADFDDHDGTRNPLQDSQAFLEACELQDIPAYLLRSKSGAGYHTYIFFKTAVPAAKARAVAFALLQEAQVIGPDAELSSFDRLFPNQDRLTGKGFGNLIALPFQGKAAKQGHTLILDPETGYKDPLPKQMEVLARIRRVPESRLDELIEDWKLVPGMSRPAGAAAAGGNPNATSVADTARETAENSHRCEFLAWAIGNPSQVPEPLWYAMISNLVRLTGGFSLCHEASRGHPGYSEEETTRKIHQALDASGPHTCVWLRDHGGFICSQLGKCKAKSPAGLVRILNADPEEGKGSGGGSNGDGQQNRVIHIDVARAVMDDYGEGNLIHVGAGWNWKWNGAGVWVRTDKRELKKKIHNLTPEGKITRSTVESILDVLQTETFLPNHEFDVERRAINCVNGELWWTGSAWELKPHCREHFRTTQIPVEYDPEARAPRFERFLEEVFEPDPDRKEKSELVKEAIGYSLLSTCEFEKFFLLHGDGENGKSVLMDTLGALVGAPNVCAVQPSQFENKFQRAHLFGKLINLVTEIAQGHEIADAQLKAIVSGELTTAEHKHKEPFDFRPFCTCWFGTNHMPHTRDFSHALFRRGTVLTFNRQFVAGAGAENKACLEATLRGELPGILNLALAGLARVFEKGTFTEPASCKEAKLEWRIEIDQAAQFVEDACHIDPFGEETIAAVYEAYTLWVRATGIRLALSKRGLVGRLLKMGAERDAGSANTKILKGIVLK